MTDTTPTPRQRAQTALATIDRNIDRQIRTPDHVWAQLAGAMTALYGPLPAETLVARLGRISAAEKHEDLRRQP